MHFYLPIAEMSANIFIFLGMGGAVGFLSGMFGVGGGFLMTPLLIFSGIPPAVAVGTEAAQIVASSVSGAIAQWRRNNVDFKMGTILLAGGLVGSVFGVQLVRLLRAIGQFDLIVALCYVTFLGIIGTLMMIESINAIRKSRKGGGGSGRRPGQHNWVHGLPLKMRFHRSKLYISAIPPLAIGGLVGVLAAIMGVGGGFIMVPAMIYLLRVPTNVVGHIAVPDRFRHRRDDDPARHAELYRRHRAGAAVDGRRRDRRAVRCHRRRKAEGRTAALSARRPGAERLHQDGMGADRYPRRTLFHRAGIRRRRALMMMASLMMATSSRARLAAVLMLTLACLAPAALAQQDNLPPEQVHADVSTRSVRVTSSFTGTEIIVFGAIVNGRPERPAVEDQYDVIVVLEGTAEKLVARRKSNVAGLWINTNALTFESVPSYYAISSSRPIDEIADPIVLRNNDIGFGQVRMKPISGWESGITTADLTKFREAVVRLKIKDGLYVQNDYGVIFVGGASLFRTTIDLPANVPVGPLQARVFLFRNGQMLSKFESQVQMRREGIELYLHNFAFGYPLLYGICAVLVAAGAGLAASSYFNRRRG